MASTTTVHLLQIILLFSTCLIHCTTCFSLHRTSLFTSQHWRNNPNNLHTSSYHHQHLNCHFTTTATALSVSSHDATTTDQWKYHSSYDDSDEIIHGKYNAVITKTTDLTNRWIGSFDPSSPLDTATLQTIHTTNNNSSPPIEALKAIQATHRWADKFVRQLNLCPWAGSSLDKEGAICYWALLIDEHDDDEGVVLNKMEEIVREAGVQLTLATSDEEGDGGGRIDPSVAISFIILVPMKRRPNNINSDALPDFGSFHEFFIDLEDRLLDECDDYWDEIDAADNNNEEENETNDNTVLSNVNSLGCEITIAAFHPKWQFNGSNEQTDGDAIDYEKRTPYPTISIVMSSVIESLMKEREEGGGSDEDNGTSSALATERIADLNEKTLCAIGRERLKEIFDEEVLGCPMNAQADDVSDE
eukprot:scaffold7985_cov108-Skeletonema_dohrnii-CCMP3373.AAC.1